MTHILRFIALSTCFSILTSCGNNPLQQTKKVNKRIRYTSALTASDKEFILKDLYNLILVCDVYEKSEFIYLTKSGTTYNVFVSDGANTEALTLYDKEDNIVMANRFNLFFDQNDNQYLESTDSILEGDEFFKLEIVDETQSFRSINKILIDDNFNSIFVEKLYDLVNCKNMENIKK